MIEVEDIIKKINKEVKARKIKARCVKGGSVAKGTFLKNDYDVDLFVRFDYSYKDQDLSVLLKKILEKTGPTTSNFPVKFWLKAGSSTIVFVPGSKVWK